MSACHPRASPSTRASPIRPGYWPLLSQRRLQDPADRDTARLLRRRRAARPGRSLDAVARLALVEIQPSPVPRLCPEGQPYIGPTATGPGARGRGVGRALVDAALTWASDHGYSRIPVDFETANPLSRPFWLNAGFRPAGYGVLRLIDRAPRQPGM